MAHIGFVSTSVLESKDGIDFSEEKRKESEEVSEAERIAKEAERKPLWEQLATKRDEEKAKFDAVRASMFAPPRPLDDEESEFLQGVEAQRHEARQRKEKWEAEELRGFAIARANKTVTIAEPKRPKPQPEVEGAGSNERLESRDSTPPPVVAVKIKAKRKKKCVSRDKDREKDEKRPKKEAKVLAEAASGGATGEANSPSVVGGSGAGGVSSEKQESAARKAGASAKEETGGPSGDSSRERNAEDGGKGLSSLLGSYGTDSEDSDEEA